MKKLASGWAEPFSSIVQDIPAGIEAKPIALEDWPPSKGLWDNAGGRITLVGDAAHAMTMCKCLLPGTSNITWTPTFQPYIRYANTSKVKGEAANHGIADIASLHRELFDNAAREPGPVDRYESEMIPRTRLAVLNSRRACLDAHDFQAITETSPLVARRVMVLPE